jgi:hypothetical protein
MHCERHLSGCDSQGTTSSLAMTLRRLRVAQPLLLPQTALVFALRNT